eukprot:SAG11_NODE_33008_length_279_cov_1.250000_1_plen_92_part_11
MGFIHGVARGDFPFRISLRAESGEQSFVVFDDPLALSRCHLCAIPTDAYVPDVRALFQRPARGLALVEALDDAACELSTPPPSTCSLWLPSS